MVDQVSRMDNAVPTVLGRGDQALCDQADAAGSLDEGAEGQRAMEIISLPSISSIWADIIDKNLSELAPDQKRFKRRVPVFAPRGAEELSAFHKRIMDSRWRDLAFGVFMSGRMSMKARQAGFGGEGAVAQNTELAATERPSGPSAREGRPETIETTFAAISTCCATTCGASTRIFCSVAYRVPPTPPANWPPIEARKRRRGGRCHGCGIPLPRLDYCHSLGPVSWALRRMDRRRAWRVFAGHPSRARKEGAHLGMTAVHGATSTVPAEACRPFTMIKIQDCGRRPRRPRAAWPGD